MPDKPISVLLIEDNPGDRRLIEASLSQGDDGSPLIVDLDADGVVAEASGSWSYDDATGILEIALDQPCPGLAGLSHTVMVGADVQAGFGYSDTALSLRAVRADADAATSC